jgi:YHS domain-containing protein
MTTRNNTAGHGGSRSVSLAIVRFGALMFAIVLANHSFAADAVVTPDQAQFGGQCVEALAGGRHVMTDCSINWTAKDGKAYCFSSADAKASFLKNPEESLERARALIAASNVQSTEEAMSYFDGSDAEKLVDGAIKSKLKANDGLFPIEDALSGDQLKLAYDGIDFTRTIDGYGFFPDVKFHDPKDEQKKYLIDWWVVPANGQLVVQETRIYQAPMQVDGNWRAVARQPIPWWWIPASEHPGHVAQKRGWEVMSAVEAHALQQSAANDGVFKLKDDKTGKTLDLKFINAHQPIRQLDDDGHYFVCSDFRAAGTRDQIYDVDFWVTEKDGKWTIDQTRVHKVPEFKNGQWVQIPRYSFKDLGNSHVVP